MTPILQTIRLALRLMEPEDEENLERLDGDSKVRAFFPDGASNRPDSQQRIRDNRASYHQSGFCDFIVELKATGAFVGRAGFHRLDDGEVEVGYVLLERCWGQGFATEVLGGLLEWAGRSLGAEAIPRRRIIAFAPLGHRASRRVMEKCAMSYFKTAEVRGTPCAFYEFTLHRIF